MSVWEFPSPFLGAHGWDHSAKGPDIEAALTPKSFGWYMLRRKNPQSGVEAVRSLEDNCGINIMLSDCMSLTVEQSRQGFCTTPFVFPEVWWA